MPPSASENAPCWVLHGGRSVEGYLPIVVRTEQADRSVLDRASLPDQRRSRRLAAPLCEASSSMCSCQNVSGVVGVDVARRTQHRAGGRNAAERLSRRTVDPDLQTVRGRRDYPRRHGRLSPRRADRPGHARAHRATTCGSAPTLDDARRDRRHDRVRARPASVSCSSRRCCGPGCRRCSSTRRATSPTSASRSRSCVPPTSSRGSTTARRKAAGRVARRVRRRSRRSCGPRASPAGASVRPTSPRCATSTDFTIYTPGSQSGVPINIVGSLQVPADIERRRDRRRRDRGLRLGPARPRRHRRRSAVEPRAHPAVEPDPQRGSARARLDLPTLVGMIARAADPQARCVRARPVLPAGRSHGVRDAAQRPARLAVVRGVGDGRRRSTSSRCCYTADGSARCAIVTTAHLCDEERQFVTSLILSKLVTWMRHQSGTTDLRVLLYMDEVAGYLPPTAIPPTKKPIMLLMKQARAFGVGVVLTTQNPVDVDYKALSNAGTWMIGRLQTDRDKQRLLDGMSAASGGVDVAARRRHDRRARQARVRPAPRRQGPSRGLHHAMGDELPPRPADARPDRRVSTLMRPTNGCASDPSVEAPGGADGRTGSHL